LFSAGVFDPQGKSLYELFSKFTYLLYGSGAIMYYIIPFIYLVVAGILILLDVFLFKKMLNNR